MSTVVLSVGSNVGDRLARLRSVTDGLGPRLRAASAVYETPPWGGVEQGPFLNAVLVAADDGLDPADWLRLAQDLERAAGRVREQRWGARSLDVDLVTCHTAEGEQRMTTADLTLPHPWAHVRAFVLAPWLDVDPHATLTVAGRPVPLTRLLADVAAAERAAVRRTALTLVDP